MNIEPLATPGLMPEPSLAFLLYLVLFVAIVIAVGVCARIAGDLVTDRGRLICGLIGLTVSAVLLVLTIMFVNTSTTDAVEAKEKWLSTTQSWAAERYGADAGLEVFTENFGLHSDSDSICPTQATCYVSDALIDGAIVSVKLVYIGEQAMLVAGDATEMKELPVLND